MTPWAIKIFPLSDDLDENIKYLNDFLNGLDIYYTYIFTMCVGMFQELLSCHFIHLGPYIVTHE